MFLTMDYNYFLQLNKNYFRASAQDKQPEQSGAKSKVSPLGDIWHLIPHMFRLWAVSRQSYRNVCDTSSFDLWKSARPGHPIILSPSEHSIKIQKLGMKYRSLTFLIKYLLNFFIHTMHKDMLRISKILNPLIKYLITSF